MIGKLYTRNERKVFDCHTDSTFAELLTWQCLEHLGGPTFAIKPSDKFSPEETHAIIADCYGAVTDDVPVQEVVIA